MSIPAGARPAAEKPSVLIFVPAYGGHVSVQTFGSVLAISAALAHRGIASAVTTPGMPDIVLLRNLVTTLWFDGSPFSHLLHIDSDMGIPPQLVLDMLDFGEPVVGALYPKKDLNLTWAASGHGLGAEVRGAFMHVEGVGAGCLLVRRDAVATMIEKGDCEDRNIDPFRAQFEPLGIKRLLRLFDNVELPDRGRVAEDLSFCMRWNACGGKVWAATHFPITHVGLHEFTACYARDGGKDRIPS